MDSSQQPSYFVRFRGRISGPFGWERLRGMASAGQISPIHEVSVDRVAWGSASEIPGLLPTLHEPAAAPQQVAEPTQPASSQERWYYLDPHGDRVGPVGRRELIDLHDDGRIDEHSPVWSKGMAEWLPFEEAGLVRSSRPAQLILEKPRGAEGPDSGRVPGVGLGVTGMVLGILALLSSCFIVIPYAGLVFYGLELVLGVLAICFGAAGMKTRGRGMSIAGLVTGIIAVAIFLFVLILFIVLIGSLAAWNERHNRWD